MSLVLQELAARYGVVTGSNLAEAVREAYPVWVTWAFYLNMEIAVMGADLQEMRSAPTVAQSAGFGHWNSVM